MLREAVIRPPARPGANAGARSSTRPPCAPTPGSRSTACGISSRARARCRGSVAPTTAPTSLRPEDSPTHSAPSSSTSSARRSTPCRAPQPSWTQSSGLCAVPPIGRSRSLAASSGPGRRRRRGWRCARAPARPRPPRGPGHERLDRVPAHQRVDVTGRARPRRPEASRSHNALRVGRGGDRDVAALAVGDHQQAALARGRDVLEPLASSRRASAARTLPAAARQQRAAAQLRPPAACGEPPPRPIRAPGSGQAEHDLRLALGHARPGCRRTGRRQRPFTALFRPLPA